VSTYLYLVVIVPHLCVLCVHMRASVVSVVSPFSPVVCRYHEIVMWIQSPTNHPQRQSIVVNADHPMPLEHHLQVDIALYRCVCVHMLYIGLLLVVGNGMACRCIRHTFRVRIARPERSVIFFLFLKLYSFCCSLFFISRGIRGN
jgi:hypothetical protein